MYCLPEQPIIAARRYAINPFGERGLVRRRVPSKKARAPPPPFLFLARGYLRENRKKERKLRRPRRRSKERVGKRERAYGTWLVPVAQRPVAIRCTLFHRKTEQKGEEPGKGKREKREKGGRTNGGGGNCQRRRVRKSEKKGGKKNSWTVAVRADGEEDESEQGPSPSFSLNFETGRRTISTTSIPGTGGRARN